MRGGIAEPCWVLSTFSLGKNIQLGQKTWRRKNHGRLTLMWNLTLMRKAWPSCCIYRVPRNLRSTNKLAYIPQSVSIGSLHHQRRRKELASMEEQKERYIKKFRKRRQVTEEKWDSLTSLIERVENIIRNCYEEISKLPSPQFVTMIRSDAVFVIELFLRNYEEKKDILINKPHLRHELSLDLQLLENQLPYFILEMLYNEFKFSKQGYPTFMNLSFLFFCVSPYNRINEQDGINHFTDLGRIALLRGFDKKPDRSDGSVVDLPCAVKLHKSGVKFKCAEKGSSMLEIEFDKDKQELQIPNLEVGEGTEILIRNIMALEECHYESEPLVCNYIDFMDFLINTEEDVDLLVENGIISNRLGDNASVAFMFNRLCRHIHFKNSFYYDISTDLKAHYQSSWNHSKANLRSVYFSDLWRSTATVAAAVLLLLTLIQAVCSLWQVL